MPPVPISRIGDGFYLFDAPVISSLRSSVGIPGLLTGTLPQASQQNVFFGLPLRLMPEEARLLVERGVAYITDDATHHSSLLQSYENDHDGIRVKARWMAALRGVGVGVAEELEAKKTIERQKALGRMNEKELQKKEKRAKEKRGKQLDDKSGPTSSGEPLLIPPVDEDRSVLTRQDFFSSDTRASFIDTQPTCPHEVQNTIDGYSITPTTSYPPFSSPTPSPHDLPSVPRSYPLFKHLHGLGYYLSPGLRFGCQYMAYPGDPLRFHSHFMTVGRDWDEEVDLLSLVGVGRLGTGVKKGVLLGGIEKKEDISDSEERVRCFCIEWGGM